MTQTWWSVGTAYLQHPGRRGSSMFVRYMRVSLWGSHRPVQHGDVRGAHPSGPKDLLSDRCVLSCPSMDLVTCLLDFRLNLASNRSIVPRLAASLAACAQLSALGKWHLCRHHCSIRWEKWSSFWCFLLVVTAASHRMWALQRLRKLLTTEFGQSINIHRLLGDNDGDTRTLVWNVPD